MHRLRLFPFLLLLLVLPTLSQARSVSICADPEPPPWTYWPRDSHGKPAGPFIGFSVDLIKTAFQRMHIEVHFDGSMPWARCLQSVQAGKTDFAMDAYYDEERARKFDYSIHYNTLTPQVFFLQRRQLPLHTKADLRSYRGCGMNGASYFHYGLNANQLDTGVNTYQQLIDKLRAGRCDYFVEELEVIAGKYQQANPRIPEDIAHLPVSDATPPQKHLITRRQSAASALLPSLNAQLAYLIRSGAAQKMWKTHETQFGYTP